MDYEGTLTKISDNKNAMRTKSMDGIFDEFPTINERFNIVGTSLIDMGDGVSLRLISTNTVIEIIYDIKRSITFKTFSGTKYCLEYK